MKLLVVIKGQLRTWNINYMHLRRFVEDTVTRLNSTCTSGDSFRADVLLSCWDLSYQMYPDSYSIDFLKKEAGDFSGEIDHFKKSPLINMFYVNQESHLSALELFSKLNFDLPEDYHFSCFLTYKTGLAKRRLEALNDESYDYVLEIRPDVFYPKAKDYLKLPKLPEFGEILSFDGLMAHPIEGLVSASIQDLIFFMTSETYDIFSKEIVFHYSNKKNSLGFTTVHFEKSLFFSKKNFVVRTQEAGLCQEPVVYRPVSTYSGEDEIFESDEQFQKFLRKIDTEWLKTKEANLQKSHAEHRNSFGNFLFEKRNENIEKIKNLLKS